MTELRPRIGVILTAFGYMRSLDELPDYLERITGVRPPPPMLQEMRSRYESMGGPGPLEWHTVRQADALQDALGPEYRVALGLRNSPPFIADVAEELARSGVERLVSIALAPQYGKQSVEGYHEAVRQGLARVDDPPPASFVRSYATHPKLVEYWADAVGEALDELPAELRSRAHVVFTVHSVPFREMFDPPVYPEESRATADAVARAAGIENYHLAFQSGHGEEWIGPDEEELLEDLAGRGVPAVVLAPVGFVAEHLETLYDLDVAAAALAGELGLAMARAGAPNDDPRFIEALADTIRSNVP